MATASATTAIPTPRRGSGHWARRRWRRRSRDASRHWANWLTNPFVAAALKRHGLTRVGWSARGFDGVACQPQDVVRRSAADLRPGAIVLLHEGSAHGHNLAIIEGVLEQLQARGLQARLPRASA